MPLPGDLTTITVTATYENMDGSPSKGTVTFAPNVVVTDSTGHVIFPAGGITATLASGALSITVPCTDNANTSPLNGWAYSVTEAIVVPAPLPPSAPSVVSRSYTILLPSSLGSTVDLSTVAPTSAPTTVAGAAGGDLAGSYPNPSVIRVRGIAVSGVAPSTGQVLTATSPSAAAWQTGPPVPLPPSGDTTGAADQVAIAAAVAAGARITLASGTFYLKQPVPVGVAGVTIAGQGQGNTTISLVSSFSDPGSVTPGGFLAPAAFQVGTGAGANANNCTITGMSITYAGTYGGTTAVTAVNNYGCQALTVQNVYFGQLNGYAIEAFSAAVGSKQITRGLLTGLTIDGCAGGIHLDGDTKTVNSNASNINWTGSTRGTTTGPAANLDALLLSNGSDFEGSNFNPGTDQGTGAAIHLNNFTFCFLDTVDGGGTATSGNTGLFLQNASNAAVSNGAFYLYNTGGIIQDTSTASLRGVNFQRNNTHGLTVSSTATTAPVTLDGCQFGYASSAENGQSNPSGPAVYDLNWTGTVKGRVSSCVFGSQIQSINVTPGVQQSVNITAAQQVTFDLVKFNGSGSNSGNWFTNMPAMVRVDNGTTFTTPAGAGLGSAPAYFTPASPTSTVSTTLVMMGLGSTIAYTPTGTGHVVVLLSGWYTVATALVNININGYYGTGTAPVNGAAVTGTRFGVPTGTSPQPKPPGVAALAYCQFPAMLALTAGTAYWFDFAISTTNASDAASVSDIACVLYELPV